MEYTRFICDVCGAEKASSDGWFAVRAGRKLTVHPWDALHVVALGEREHICGQECLHKRLSRWLDTMQLTAEGVAA